MKNKLSILSFSFSLMVMTAILLQSLHTFKHLGQFVTEKHCHHKYALNKPEINHQHHDFDHCFVCEFAFSNFISTSKISFTSSKIEVITKYYSSYSKEITQFFRGALFALRAPPTVIV